MDPYTQDIQGMCLVYIQPSAKDKKKPKMTLTSNIGVNVYQCSHAI